MTHDIWGEVLAAWLPQRPVRRIVVTHFHHEHLAGRLAEDHGVTVSMTLGEFMSAHAIWHQLPGFDIETMARHFARHGLSATACDALRNFGNRYRKGAPTLPQRFDRLFDDDAEYRRAAVAHHLRPRARTRARQPVLRVGRGADLGRHGAAAYFHQCRRARQFTRRRRAAQFLDLLARLSLPQDTLVLPSHGLPFYGLQTRIAALGKHHDERCAELLAAIDEPKSAAELMPVLFSRPLDTFQTMFAMGEAIAHLNHLLHAGKAIRAEASDGIIRFVGTHDSG